MFKFVKTSSIYVLCTVFFVILIILDQGCKYAVLKGYSIEQSFCSFVPVFNRGIALSIGASFPLSMAAIVCITYGALLALIFLSGCFIEFPLSCTFLCAGALSNIIDRVMYGAVVDYIGLFLCNIAWPIFNIADVAIVCSVMWIIGVTTARSTRLIFVKKHKA